MLDEVRKSYYECASIIPDWKKLSRSELCNKYLEVKDTNKYLAESYLSAIICKFWNVFEHNFKTQHGTFYSEIDYYQSGIDGILEALNKHIWTDPNNKLYGDCNAPEKVINVIIYSRKNNIYQAASRQKRRLNIGNQSLQEMQEQNVDSIYLKYTDDIDMSEIVIADLVKYYFLHFEYLKAFVLDAIINVDLLSGNNYLQKLKTHIYNMPDSYIKVFSKQYDIDIFDVSSAVQGIKHMKNAQFDRQLHYVLGQLQHSKYIKDLIKK